MDYVALFSFLAFLDFLSQFSRNCFQLRRLIEQEVGNDLSGSNLFDLITKCQYRITENN